MWGPPHRNHNRITCPACGASLTRSEAREYDKHGDRWDRRNKDFEYFCKSCHADLCHQHRDDLEELLCEINAGKCSDSEFFFRYWTAVEDRYGPIEER